MISRCWLGSSSAWSMAISLRATTSLNLLNSSI